VDEIEQSKNHKWRKEKKAYTVTLLFAPEISLKCDESQNREM